MPDRMSKALLRVECQDCPTRVNPDWGYVEHVAFESPDEIRVKAWAWRHTASRDSRGDLNPTEGHQLKFSRVIRISADVEHLNAELLQRLCGGDGA